MAINRDPAEWFERPDRWEDVVYGILKATNEWVVLKRKNPDEWDSNLTKVSELARVESREAAIGFIKLLVEK